MSSRFSPFRIVHIIPYHGIGGVESAANTLTTYESSKFCFSLFAIFPVPVDRINFLSRLSYYLRASCYLIKNNPDILVVSLWRSCIVAVLTKILRPSTKLVLFLHLSSDVHFVDFLFTRLVRLLSIRVWADSSFTLHRRLPRLRVESRVISFVTRHIDQNIHTSLVKPVFIYWGRIHHQKNIPCMISLFYQLSRRLPSAKLYIIGPDGGDLSHVKQLVNELSLSASIEFLGPLHFSDISYYANKSSFYLQTSNAEGFGLSVVESMQLGLVPVTTPVGEIPNYIVHGFNGLLIDNTYCIIDELYHLCLDNSRYHSMRLNSLSTWKDAPLYRSDVIDACSELITNI